MKSKPAKKKKRKASRPSAQAEVSKTTPEKIAVIQFTDPDTGEVEKIPVKYTPTAEGIARVREFFARAASGEIEVGNMKFVNPVTGQEKTTWYHYRPNSAGETYVRALRAKIQGKEMIAETRSMLVADLCNSKDWTPFVDLISRYAAARDTQFFEMLGKGLYEGRKRLFSEVEKHLGLHWHEGPSFPSRSIGPLPGLKWWRDEAVRTWLSAWFYGDPEPDVGLKLKAYQSMRDRLDLVPEKKKLVRKIEFRGCVKRGPLDIRVS